MKSHFNFNSIPLIILTSVSLLMLNACKDDTSTTISAKAPTPSRSIPQERLGLDGQHDLSGLAKRVAEAIKQDSSLASIASIYVAQTKSKIVLKGAISDRSLLDKIVKIARSVDGVTQVDASQVQIR